MLLIVLNTLILMMKVRATSFPGSLFFPFPSLALGGGKKRDPGNEVEVRALIFY